MDNLILSPIPLEELKKVLIAEIKAELSKLPAFETESKERESLLTRKETAELLQVSLVTLNEWTKDGIIKAHRIGSRVRYKYSEILESLKKIETYRAQ